MGHRNPAPIRFAAAALLSAVLILPPPAESASGLDIEDRVDCSRFDQLAEKARAADVEWKLGRLYVNGKERETGGSIRIWIFNVDSDERDMTSLFVQQSLKRLILGFGDDEIVLNRNKTKSMRSLHNIETSDESIHIQTSEAVYFGDQGCEFDLKYSYADGTTTERLGLDFCRNVRGTSGTSGRVGFAVDGNSVFELDSYLAASKSRTYWNKIERFIVRHWNKGQ